MSLCLCPHLGLRRWEPSEDLKARPEPDEDEDLTTQTQLHGAFRLIPSTHEPTLEIITSLLQVYHQEVACEMLTEEIQMVCFILCVCVIMVNVVLETHSNLAGV